MRTASKNLFGNLRSFYRTKDQLTNLSPRDDKRSAEQAVCYGAASKEKAMDITSINRSVPVPAATAQPDATDVAAQNREVVQAVKAVNGAELLGENELEFQKDPQTQRMLVRIVDRKTKEVISQVPPEYVIRLAEDLKATRI